ncbi:MAG: hypothetical protein ACKOFI_02060, partial [Phycisphaerales bacterium]
MALAVALGSSWIREPHLVPLCTQKLELVEEREPVLRVRAAVDLEDGGDASTRAARTHAPALHAVAVLRLHPSLARLDQVQLIEQRIVEP